MLKKQLSLANFFSFFQWGLLFILAGLSGTPAVFAQSVIGCDQELSASISTAGEKDQYLISANNGDKVRIRAYSSVPLLNLLVEVRSPADVLLSSILAGSSGFVEIPELHLDQGNGQYKITISDGVGNQTGAYNLSVQILNKTTCADQVSCTADASASYYYSAEVDAYYITASNGDSLRLRMYFESPDPEWRVEVRRPDGSVYEVLAQNSSGLLQKVIPLTAGNWYFYVYDEGGDETTTSHYYNYSFQILNKTTCANQVSCTADASASYYYSAEVDAYYVTASNGDSLRLRMYFESPDPEWRVEVRRPDGSVYEVLAQNSSGLLQKVIPLTAGNWYFYVYDEGGDEATTSHYYNYSFQILNKTTCADQVSCTADASASYYYSAEVDAYYVTASNGDSLRLRMYFESPDPEWRVEVRRPDGSVYEVLAQNSSGLLQKVIPLTAGNWYFYVYDEGGDETTTSHYYNYSFQILNKTTCANQVSCTADASASYYYSAEADAYYVTATNGELLRIRMYFESPEPEWRVEVRRPDGSVHSIFQQNGSGLLQTNISLTMAGNWYFYVYDEGGDEATTSHYYNYSFQILNKTTCADQVSCTADASDSYYYSAEVNAYYIPASNGELLRLRMYFESPDPEWRVEVRRPDGSVYSILQQNGSGLLQTNIPLTMAGNWFFYVYDEGGDEATTSHYYNYSFQILNKTTCADQVSCTADASDSYYYSAEVNAYYIPASIGELLRLRMYFNSPDPEWRVEVRKPDGTPYDTLMLNGSGLLQTDIPLMMAGNWFFYVYDEGGDEANNSHSYNYSFQLVKPSCASSINCGNTITQSLFYKAEADAYAFYAEACDTVHILMTSTDPSFHESVWLYGPNGNLIAFDMVTSNTASAVLDVPLDPYGYGNYIIVVGETEGDNTGNYALELACVSPSLSANPASLSVSAAAGSQTFSIISTCPNWSVSESANWFSLSPTNGGGNGTVTASFDPNLLSSPRSAIITLAGCCDTVIVNATQAGATLIVNPTFISVGFAAGQTTFDVSGTCSNWMVSGGASWIDSVGPSSGVSPQTVSVFYGANLNANSRSTTLTLSGCGLTRTVTIVQEGVTLIANPNFLNLGAGMGQTSFSISSNCPSWTVSENANWLTVSPDNGSGNGMPTVFFEKNPNSFSRSTTITISGCGIPETVSVTQAGATLFVSPTSFSVSKAQGQAIFNVSGTCCDWTVSENANWLSVNPTNGTEPGAVTIFYDPNTGPNSRNATITITGCGITQIVTITQEGTTFITVTPELLNLDWPSGQTTFDISSNCGNWTVSDNGTWLSTSLLNGGGNGTVTVFFNENTNPTPRNATITITGCGITLTISVTQTGHAILIASPEMLSVGASLGQTTFNVTSNCNNWTVSEDANWLTVSPDNGTGDGTVAVIFEANPLSSDRTATITITGCGITVTIIITQQGMLNSTNDLLEGNRLLVLPNPAAEAFFVEISPEMIPCQLAIHSSSGRFLLAQPVKAGGKFRVEREGMPDGVYFLQLVSLDGQLLASGKIVLAQ